MTQLLTELRDEVRPITRAEYDRMIEVGLFDDDEHVELIDGVIVTMAAEGPRHIWVTRWLTNYLARNLDEDLVVGVGHPIALGDLSQPQPDIHITPSNWGSPTEIISDALLLIEVSFSSRRKDRVVKADLYARHGLREYWIVDLVSDVVVVHRDPTPEGYATVSEHGAGETLDAVGAQVPIAAFLTPDVE